jgi:hypothetical protein
VMLDAELAEMRLLPETGTPVDQPLFGRCGLCGEPVIYGCTKPARRGDSSRGKGGLILEPVAVRGSRFVLCRDGRYERQTGGEWGQRVHACPRRLLLAIRREERARWKVAS